MVRQLEQVPKALAAPGLVLGGESEEGRWDGGECRRQVGQAKSLWKRIFLSQRFPGLGWT